MCLAMGLRFCWRVCEMIWSRDQHGHLQPILMGSLVHVSSYKIDTKSVSGIKTSALLLPPSSKECAKAFHAAGSRLVLCGRNGERLQDLVQELSAKANHAKNVSVGREWAVTSWCWVCCSFHYRICRISC